MAYIPTSLYADPTERTQEMEDFGIRTLPEYTGSTYNLGSVEGFPDIDYATTDYNKYSDLYRLYSGMPGGFGTTPAATTPVATTPAATTPSGGGSGGGGGTSSTGTTTSTGVNTPFEQNLIDQGVGLQIAPGQPVVAPGEVPLTNLDIAIANNLGYDGGTGEGEFDSALTYMTTVNDPTSEFAGLGTQGQTDPGTWAGTGAGQIHANEFEGINNTPVNNIPVSTTNYTDPYSILGEEEPSLTYAQELEDIQGDPYTILGEENAMPTYSEQLDSLQQPTYADTGDPDLLDLAGGEAGGADAFGIISEPFGTGVSTIANPEIFDTYGASVNDPQVGDPGFINYTPSTQVTQEQENTIQNAINSAGGNVQAALTALGNLPGAVVDFANQTVDIAGQQLNVGQTIANSLINIAVGQPVTLVFSALGNILGDTQTPSGVGGDIQETGDAVAAEDAQDLNLIEVADEMAAADQAADTGGGADMSTVPMSSTFVAEEYDEIYEPPAPPPAPVFYNPSHHQTGGGPSSSGGGATSGGGHSGSGYQGASGSHHWAKGGRVRYSEGGIVSLKNAKR